MVFKSSLSSLFRGPRCNYHVSGNNYFSVLSRARCRRRRRRCSTFSAPPLIPPFIPLKRVFLLHSSLMFVCIELLVHKKLVLK